MAKPYMNECFHTLLVEYKLVPHLHGEIGDINQIVKCTHPLIQQVQVWDSLLLAQLLYVVPVS